MKEIVLIFRKPFAGQVSIEYLFYNISAYLKNGDVAIVNQQLSYYSNTLMNRWKNLVSVTTYKKKIIHVTGDVHYALLGAWFSKRVLTIHDLGFMLNKGVFAKFIYWLLWIYLPVKFAHRVTVVSESTKQDLLRYMRVDAQKIMVIGNFIDEIYQPAVGTRKTAGLRLLQVGTAFNKNIERLIYAIEGMDCTLTIIGKIPEPIAEMLKAHKISYENRYDLTIEALYLEYQQHDMLCYVSTLEGFGLPILEAQATGMPVLCSDCSSMPEVAGNAACFVDPFDVIAIRNGINMLTNNPAMRKELIRRGFDNAKRFSKDAIAKEYYKLYQSL